MKREYSTEELAEVCSVTAAEIRRKYYAGNLDVVKDKRNRIKGILLDDDALARLKAFFAAKHRISSVVVHSDLLALREAALARHHEVALAAVFQAYAVTQATESPQVPWDDLASMLQLLGVAPQEHASDWLKKLLHRASTGRESWCHLEYIMPDRIPPDQGKRSKQKRREENQADDGYWTVIETSEALGIPKATVQAMCRQGRVEGAKRRNGKGVWMIPLGWHGGDWKPSPRAYTGPKMHKGPRLPGRKKGEQ